MPTRVLDLQANGSFGEIRLVNSNHALGRWVCLSHCWGVEQPCKTTPSNFEQRLKSIYISELPQTFKDAVVITRALGFRYLWIDSLCIIQGSSEDWRREAYLMTATYGLAHLTLAATAGANCFTGLSISPDRKPFVKISSVDQLDPQYSFFVRPSISHADFAFGGGRAASHPLKKRAWVFQEHILSPRVLQFGASELVWEGNECFECECNAGLEPDCVNLKRKGPLQIKAWFNQMLSRGTESLDEFHKFWVALVSDYSTKKLTYESDRLVAFEGIGRLIAAMLETEYHNGHFELNLIQSLLWTNAFRTPRAKQHLDPNIASWSWASVGGEVVYPFQDIEGTLFAEVYQTGFASSLEIISLQGVFLPAKLRLHTRVFGENPRSPDEQILIEQGMPVGTIEEVVVERYGCTIPVSLDYLQDRHGHSIVLPEGTDVLCLLIGFRHSGILMLVLRRVDLATEQPVYERIGTSGSYLSDSVSFLTAQLRTFSSLCGKILKFFP